MKFRRLKTLQTLAWEKKRVTTVTLFKENVYTLFKQAIEKDVSAGVVRHPRRKEMFLCLAWSRT